MCTILILNLTPTFNDGWEEIDGSVVRLLCRRRQVEVVVGTTHVDVGPDVIGLHAEIMHTYYRPCSPRYSSTGYGNTKTAQHALGDQTNIRCHKKHCILGHGFMEYTE